MSLAPASSRGAFLKARLAVNGIQCAARSLGTLTAVGRGLLSSIGASLKFWDMAAFQVSGCSGLRASYQLRPHTGTPTGGYISVFLGRFQEQAAVIDRRRRSRTPR